MESPGARRAEQGYIGYYTSSARPAGTRSHVAHAITLDQTASSGRAGCLLCLTYLGKHTTHCRGETTLTFRHVLSLCIGPKPPTILILPPLIHLHPPSITFGRARIIDPRQRPFRIHGAAHLISARSIPRLSRSFTQPVLLVTTTNHPNRSERRREERCQAKRKGSRRPAELCRSQRSASGRAGNRGRGGTSRQGALQRNHHDGLCPYHPVSTGQCRGDGSSTTGQKAEGSRGIYAVAKRRQRRVWHRRLEQSAKAL